MKMTPPQLRQAVQAGLITREQAKSTAMAQHARDAAQDEPTATPGDDGQNAGSVAQSVADLTARAAGLRNKIQSAFDTGGAAGARDLATYRQALADTEAQFHSASQTLLSGVPAPMQQRIAQAVAPDLDWDNARQKNAADPMAYFATENLGSALRDQDIAPDLQQRIRQLAISRGINPDLADHIANQAGGANAVNDLLTVLRGGSIDPGKAQTLQDMGFLQPSDPSDPDSPLHLTEDAQPLLPPGAQRFVQLKPDVARYTPSPDPAHGSALYQNAVAGMEHFSNTARNMLPAPASVDSGGDGTANAGADTQPNVPGPETSKAAAGTEGRPRVMAAPGNQATGSTASSGRAGNAGADSSGGAGTAATEEWTSGGGAFPENEGRQGIEPNAPLPALADTPQQALQDAADGKKTYL